MWHRVLPSRATLDDRDRFVIASHHPDRLRRPAASVGTVSDERLQQALTWNVFRTLELVSPSFWLRRFHTRLTGEPSVVPPQIASIHLWQHLPLPPIQRIDGDRSAVTADVVIETEHAVWVLVVACSSKDLTEADRAAAVVDAGVWFAGARQLYCGVIEAGGTNSSLASVLQTRYCRSRESAWLRSATRGPAASTHIQWGAIAWTELAAVLKDCCEASALPRIERALAGNVLEWLSRIGINPTGDAVSRTREHG